MNNGMKIGLVIGIAVIISSFVLGFFFYQAQRSQNSIQVVGIASKQFEADTVKWVVTIEESVGLDELKQGYEQLENSSKLFTDLLKTKEISLEEIIFKPINVYQEYGQDGPKGYKVQQSIFVISNDIATIEDLALNPSQLLDNGILIHSSNLQYYYSKIDDLKKEIIAEATVNATERANRMLEKTDLQLGKLLAIKSGVFQITEPYSTMVSAGGIYETATRKKQIRVTVHATFAIES